MYYIVVHMIDGTAHTVKFQICTIGGAHIIFQTFVAAIYFIFKCRLTLQFEGGCYIAWQLAFMTQLELTRERFLFIEQLPLLYVDLPLRFRPLGHSAWVNLVYKWLHNNLDSKLCINLLFCWSICTSRVHTNLFNSIHMIT